MHQDAQTSFSSDIYFCCRRNGIADACRLSDFCKIVRNVSGPIAIRLRCLNAQSVTDKCISRVTQHGLQRQLHLFVANAAKSLTSVAGLTRDTPFLTLLEMTMKVKKKCTMKVKLGQSIRRPGADFGILLTSTPRFTSFRSGTP